MNNDKPLLNECGFLRYCAVVEEKFVEVEKFVANVGNTVTT